MGLTNACVGSMRMPHAEMNNQEMKCYFPSILFLIVLINCVQCVLDPVVGELRGKDELVKWYFNNGFSYQEILSFLSVFHGIVISMRSLHRVLRSQRLGRKVRAYHQPLPEIFQTVQMELVGSGSSVGYREVHQRLKARGIQVDRETVRIAIKVLDREGVVL